MKKTIALVAALTVIASAGCTTGINRVASSVAPTMVVFFFAQKVFVQGISLTGVKG